MTKCWCGTETEAWDHPDYDVCPRDGTFVLHDDKRPANLKNFYGKRAYWEEHVTDYGFPTLDCREPEMRDRVDTWAKRIIQKCHGKVPASVFEIGCAEGTFLKEMRRRGSMVVGQDVDEETAKYVRETHDAECLSGLFPESRPLWPSIDEDPQQFEVVCGFDVFEHVPDPVNFLRAAWEHVEPGGLMVFQTPWYRGEGPSFKHFKAPEHLHIWTAPAVVQVYQAAGVTLNKVTDSHFAKDMLLWSFK